MKYQLLFMLLLLGCASDSSRDSTSTSSSKEKKDDDTGSSIYIPDDGEDVEIEEGASVADDTTGAYLSMPKGIEAAGKSTNISSDSSIIDSKIANYQVRIPINTNQQQTALDNPNRLVLFYHIIKEDEKNYYGVIPASDMKVTETYVQADLRGLGNYQPGIAPSDVTSSKEVETSHTILTKSLADKSVSAVYVDGDFIYAGMERGYLYLSSDGGKSFSQKKNTDGLESVVVNDITGYNDAIYVSTTNGIAVSSDKGTTFQMLTKDNGLADNDVRQIAFGNDGTLYAATRAGVSVSSDGARFTDTYTESDGLPSNNVSGVSINASGNMAVATDEGVAYKGNSESRFSSNSRNLDSKEIHRVLVDSSNRLWVGTQGELKYASTFPPVNGFTQPSNNANRDYSSDGRDFHVIDDNVYAATDAGIHSFTFVENIEDNYEKYTAKNHNLADDTVYSIYVSSDGTLYAGTKGGLCKKSSDAVKFTTLDFGN